MMNVDEITQKINQVVEKQKEITGLLLNIKECLEKKENNEISEELKSIFELIFGKQNVKVITPETLKRIYELL